MNPPLCPLVTSDHELIRRFLTGMPLQDLIFFTERIFNQLTASEKITFNINFYCSEYSDYDGRIRFITALLDNAIISMAHIPFSYYRDPRLIALLRQKEYEYFIPIARELGREAAALSDDLETAPASAIKVANPRWIHVDETRKANSSTIAALGDTIILLVDVAGYPEGAPVTFDVFDGSIDPAMRIETERGKNEGGTASVQWTVSDPNQRGKDLKLLFEGSARSKSSGRVPIGLAAVYRVELLDDDGKPVEGVKVEFTVSGKKTVVTANADGIAEMPATDPSVEAEVRILWEEGESGSGGEKGETEDPADPATGVDEIPPVTVEPGCRPGYIGKEEPASAPNALDFNKTGTILKDLTEEEFRNRIALTINTLDNLGLNRSIGGEDRAAAYLDMVTWDDAYRESWKNDNTVNSSSCGMFVRNTWWLCGARGCQLLDEAYKGGVITKLLEFAGEARRAWGSGFTVKTFFPKVGDVIYLYDPAKNSQHIFTISGIDKTIVDEDGQTTVYNDDNTPASEITFTSVDGGQADGVGPDGNGTSKKWGCQAIKQVKRKMKLNNGHFMSVGTAWPFPDGTKGRPINTWIDIGRMQDKFTANSINPVRSISSFTAGDPIVASAGFVDPTASGTAPNDFYKWPEMGSPLPDDIVNRILTNRNNLQIHSGLSSKINGYTYGGKSFSPTEVCTAEEKNKPKIAAIIERLNIEMSGEGYTSAVMTGDGAGFTWGRGLAHGGVLEKSMREFLDSCSAAQKAFLEYGITLDGTIWKIVDTASKEVNVDSAAISLLNGSEPADLKKRLLSVFIKVAEDNGTLAANAQWGPFKKSHFYADPPPQKYIDSWSPEAICYVIHCKAWGKWSNFKTWPEFESTNGDLGKILKVEVDHMKYYDDNGRYFLVKPARKLESGGEVYPSTTMLGNMGHKILITDRYVEPIPSPEYAFTGDIVFQMIKSAYPSEYYVLRGSSEMTHADMDAFIEKHENEPMDQLIDTFLVLRGNDDPGYKKVLKMRNWYTSSENPKCELYGPRPRIAMDAVLHFMEGETAGWLLEDCKRANITPDNEWSDEYNIVKESIGIV